jgi:membrane protein DedA with SNARE-associated domain
MIPTAMNLQHFVEQYGYLAILIGTFLEGETILVLGGLAAHLGYLSLPGVILAAFGGSLFGDQLFFFIGRRNSRAILGRRPIWKARAERVHRLLQRYEAALILSFRFFYGLRTVTPFVIGASPVSTGKFVVLNVIGALVWAVTIGLGGYFFGQALAAVIGDLKRYQAFVFAALAFIGAAIWGIRFYRRRKKPREAAAPEPNHH